MIEKLIKKFLAIYQGDEWQFLIWGFRYRGLLQKENTFLLMCLSS